MSRGSNVNSRGVTQSGRGLQIGSVTTVTEVTWSTATEWDAGADDGTVHESVANTDHNDDTIVKQGYQIASPFNGANLTAYWPFHEDSGSTANDLSGNNNDGTISGATLNATGLLGTSSYSFDGTDDYVDIPNTLGVFDGSADFTLAYWINPDDVTTDFLQAINTRGEHYVVCQNDGSDGFKFRIVDGGSTAHEVNISSTDYGTGWRFIVNRFQSGNRMSIWQNSLEKDSKSITFTSIQSNSNDSAIGSASNLSGSFWNGNIADVRVYSSALSSSEIQTLYDVVATVGEHTSSWKTLNAAATSLDATASIPTNTAVDIIVEQDVGSDGAVDNSQTVSLSDGTNTYSLSGFSSSDGQYRIRIQPDNTDTVSVASVDSATVAS